MTNQTISDMMLQATNLKAAAAGAAFFFFFLKGSQNIRLLSPRSRTSQLLASRPGNLGVCGAVESSANEITSLHHFGKTHTGFDAHAVEHVDNILRGDVAG